MEFFNSAVGVLQTLVIALGAGLGIWGAINLMEGYGNDNPGAKGAGRASAEYQTAFWNAMRKKNYYDVNNALSIGEDAEGGYLVPDEFERNWWKDWKRRVSSEPLLL